MNRFLGMRKSVLFFILGLWHFQYQAQITKDTLILDSLRSLELRISGLSEEMLNGADEETRLTSTYFLIKNLVAAFRIENSFIYPFDSLSRLSVVSPPDRHFRIFTWSLVLANGTHRQFGVIQFNPAFLLKNSSLELPPYLPLIDRSDSLDFPDLLVTDHNRWFGALYYSIIPTKVGKKTYYTLLGLDGNNAMSNRKVMDVMYFENGKAIFGAPIILTRGKPALRNRVVFEYANDATMTLRWQEDKKSVVFSNLVPPEGGSWDNPKSFIPDGSFDYFKWEKNQWRQFIKFKDYYIQNK